MSESPPWYVSDPDFVTDEEYLPDYAAAMKLRGLAQKKALRELIEYNCLRQLDGLYSVFYLPEKTRHVSVDGITFVYAMLLFNASMLEYAANRPIPFEVTEAATERGEFGLEGWILEESILKLSEEEMKTEIDKSRESN